MLNKKSELPNKLIIGLLERSVVGIFNPLAYFHRASPSCNDGETYHECQDDWNLQFPDNKQIVICPLQKEGHIGNAEGCKIVSKYSKIPEGWSNASDLSDNSFCCNHPDGMGGWFSFKIKNEKNIDV